jgi:hypothetical protein
MFSWFTLLPMLIRVFEAAPQVAADLKDVVEHLHGISPAPPEVIEKLPDEITPSNG